MINELGLSLEHVSYVLGHSDTKITRRYVNIKPQVAKNSIDILFNDLKTELEKASAKINDSYRLAECFQTALFFSKEFNEVTK